MKTPKNAPAGPDSVAEEEAPDRQWSRRITVGRGGSLHVSHPEGRLMERVVAAGHGKSITNTLQKLVARIAASLNPAGLSPARSAGKPVALLAVVPLSKHNMR